MQRNFQLKSIGYWLIIHSKRGASVVKVWR